MNNTTKPADLPAGKVWLTSKYLNRIGYRALTKYERRSPGNLHYRVHGSWAEGHAAVVADRQRDLLQAERAVKNAKASLARAIAMTSKEAA